MTERKMGEISHPESLAGLGCHEKVRELVKEYLPKPCVIADLAAGEGAFSKILHSLGHDVYAFDATRDHWKLPEIPLHLCNFDTEFAETISSKDNKFDAAVAIEIIEHLENPFRFIRECAKVIKPGGLLILTTPNVESVFSRLLFLYTGRLNAFGWFETVRPAHITPIFRWKMEMMLNEADFECVCEDFVTQPMFAGKTLKSKLAGLTSRLIEPFVKGEKGGETRIIIALKK